MLSTASFPAAPGDRPNYTYRTDANEVRLTFSATDQNDHGVATLQAKDFAVVDNGFIVRDFQSFTRSDYTSLEIAIVIDCSGSMGPLFRKEIASALDLLGQTSGVPDENIALFSFQDAKPILLCAGNCRSSRAVDQLPSTRAGGLTPLYDTIIAASEYLAARGDAQSLKALVLLSDGQDTVSRSTAPDALDSLMKHDIRMYSIDMGNPNTSSPGAQMLRAFAAASGGHYFLGRDATTHALNSILEGFRATYLVSYRLPSLKRGFHNVRILPTHNVNLQFRSRSGYYFPNNIR